MNPDDWHRAASNVARHRLDTIQAAYADIPTTPAIERLYRVVAWDLAHDHLEAFCAIPALLRHGATATPIEVPL